MKKLQFLILFSLLFILRGSSQTNFYHIIDSLYSHDSSLMVNDTLKNGVQKEFDRMNLLFAPRLAPHGDFSVAATAFNGYVNSFNNQGVSSIACGTEPTVWQEEGPYDKANYGYGLNGGNGQINRITYDPRFNTTVNGQMNQTIYAGSFFGGLWKSMDDGENWSGLNTDLALPQTSVSGIAVSYQNPDQNLFITTGNGDALNFRNLLYFGNGNGVPTSIFTSGVYRSTNGGTSWQAINNGFIGTTNIGVTTSDIMIDPQNENTLYLVASNGLYKCTNALSGTPNWIKLNTPLGISEKFASLKFHPNNSQVIYASSDEVIMSTDGGATWTSLTGVGTALNLRSLPFAPSTITASFKPLRIKLAVTPAAQDRIYMYTVGLQDGYIGSLKKSVSSRYIYYYENGAWTQLYYNATSPTAPNYISTSWMGFAVSPVDPATVLFGSVRFAAIGLPPVNRSVALLKRPHDDIHEIVFEPNHGAYPDYMIAHHGGISQTFPHTLNPQYVPPTVKDLRSRSNGINTSMLWGLDVSNVDNNRILMGRQDNGSHESTDNFNSWSNKAIIGGDGYGVAYTSEHKKPVPDRVINYNGRLYLKKRPTTANYVQITQTYTDNEIYYSKMPSGIKAKLHPELNTTIIGIDDLWSDYDATASLYPYNRWKIQSDIYDHWKFIHTSQRRVLDFDIAASNPDHVYVVTYSQDGSGYFTNLHKSTTGLKNNVYNFPNTNFTKKFQDITANLPSVIYNGANFTPAIAGIAVSKNDHQKAWIALSGYHNNQKVYRTEDGGTTWVNADPNQCLPNLPANAIVYQDGTDDRIYLAMDNGIYVSDNIDYSWKRLGADFPNVMTMQLHINECSNKLYVGTYGRGIWTTDLLPNTQELSEKEISNNTLWDENRVISGNIIVKAPNKLTITSTIYMPTEGKIIVEPGAELEVNGGTITNSCGSSWYGIIVHGDNNLSQTGTNQGKLSLKAGALLDNVAYAISFRDEDDWNLSGGLVEAEDATFRVTRRAVEFMSYPNHINNSYFKRCTFEYVTSINEQPLSLVTLWNNKGVTFYGCTFKDETDINQYHENVGNGIFSIDASYSVIRDCFTGGRTCPAANTTRSSFKNFNQGIYATGSAGQHTILVDEADFIDNSMACRIEGLDNVRFTRNTVLTGGIEKDGFILNNALNPYKQQKGFYAKNATGYEVEQNTFEERTNTKEDMAGINIINSGEDINEVYNNTFKNNTIGQKYDALNRNPNQLRSFVGLQFLCNNNAVDNRKDVQINHGGISQFDYQNHGIRKQQGSSSASAANLFSSSVVNDGHIDNKSFQALSYHYNQNVLAEEPLDYTQGLVLPNAITSSNACATRIMNIVGNAPTTQLNTYYQNRQQYESLLYTYHQNIDGGNTDSLLEIIQLSIPSQAQQLRDELMEDAPYLSTEALWDAAGSGILTDALLLEICLANPEATMNEEFLNYVEFEIPNPLPANMVQLIYLNWSTETPRTILEGQLGDYSSDLGRVNSQILHFYAMDSLDWKDSIRSLLTSKKSLISLYQLVEFEMQQENYSTALNQLNTIANQHELSATQLAEHLNLKALVNFKAAILSEGISYMKLTEIQLSSLRQIAEASTGRSSTLARNILCFGYGECQQESGEPQERKKVRRVYSDIVPQATVSSKLTLSPNPSSSFVKLNGIEFDHEKGETIIFNLFTTDGKELIQQQISQSNTKIDLSELAKGNYVYRIFNNGNQIAKGVLSKQ